MFNFKTSFLGATIQAQVAKRAKNKKQGGFTNVQIAIGILVGVILLLGSLSGYQYINQAKVNNEISTLSDLRTATVRYGQFSGVLTSSNMTTAILNGLNFFTSSGLSVTGSGGTTAVGNQWGGTVVPTVGTINTAGDSIIFTFSGVSTYACKELGTKLDNIASIISINATVTKASGASSNAATVGTACTSGDANSMAYTFSR
jgi:hypothetical protein